MLSSYIWVGILGLIFGSFLNVVALRDADRKSIISGRSKCPHCSKELAARDLMPLLSYMWNLGKCRNCKKTISWRYPLVELLTAFLLVYLFHFAVVGLENWLYFAVMGISILLLAVVALIDIATFEVPIEYVVIAGVIGGVGNIVLGQLDILSVILGIVAGAGAIAAVLYGWKALFNQDGMGEGDIWIAGAIGAIVGYPLIWPALIVAVFSGAIVGSFLQLSKKNSLSGEIPFGPYLFSVV